MAAKKPKYTPGTHWSPIRMMRAKRLNALRYSILFAWFSHIKPVQMMVLYLGFMDFLYVAETWVVPLTSLTGVGREILETNNNKRCIIMLCDYYPVLYYLGIRNHTINVTYPDILVSNIPLTPRHGLFCICPQPIRVCIAIQHRLCLAECIHRMIPAGFPNAMQYCIIFLWFSHIKTVQII